MAQAPLQIPCALASTGGHENDHLRVEAAVLADSNLAITIEDNKSSSCVMLDREAARQLFNYIGVWLHKHPSS